MTASTSRPGSPVPVPIPMPSASSRLYLSVDCGGSKTAAAVADGRGVILGRGLGGAANYTDVGLGNFLRSVRNTVDAAMSAVAAHAYTRTAQSPDDEAAIVRDKAMQWSAQSKAWRRHRYTASTGSGTYVHDGGTGACNSVGDGHAAPEPSSFDDEGSGAPRFSLPISNSVLFSSQQQQRHARPPPPPPLIFEAAWFGIAGVDSPADVMRLSPHLASLLSLPHPSPRLIVANDTSLLAAPVHDAAFPGTRTGVVTIAGTGSIVMSYRPDQQGGGLRTIGRAGGFGWLLGDEGSGYAVGRDAVRKVLEQADRERIQRDYAMHASWHEKAPGLQPQPQQQQQAPSSSSPTATAAPGPAAKRLGLAANGSSTFSASYPSTSSATTASLNIPERSLKLADMSHALRDRILQAWGLLSTDGLFNAVYSAASPQLATRVTQAAPRGVNSPVATAKAPPLGDAEGADDNDIGGKAKGTAEPDVPAGSVPIAIPGGNGGAGQGHDTACEQVRLFPTKDSAQLIRAKAPEHIKLDLSERLSSKMLLPPDAPGVDLELERMHSPVPPLSTSRPATPVSSSESEASSSEGTSGAGDARAELGDGLVDDHDHDDDANISNVLAGAAIVGTGTAAARARADALATAHGQQQLPSTRLGSSGIAADITSSSVTTTTTNGHAKDVSLTPTSTTRRLTLRRRHYGRGHGQAGSSDDAKNMDLAATGERAQQQQNHKHTLSNGSAHSQAQAEDLHAHDEWSDSFQARKHRLASLAPIVFHLAFNRDDALSLEILRSQARQIALQILDVVRPDGPSHCHLSTDESVLCMGGSLFGVERYQHLLIQELAKFNVHFARHVFIHDPARGGATALACIWEDKYKQTETAHG
ncbi:hypothetical protein K437DRAFT_259725 [Tilletiaria anomala UBC 951]|uniref:N-acetyl-D-glucosamine kinase n=1 Tax=Tilletiaria anomala (strain ATCC 24038 / CBS 436.72 / UBC 951) TaxID=1037660 RepID=A0A066V848_TILAU|nr:uncharacterized protein K437DRAFT_259725 [Tilletiaria anomala UBC 951]KDN37666.1 hypothetical protein K437DRAFT_259725 [Tilletiaria anomala UBC 951]